MSDYQGNIVIKNPATPTGPSTFGRAPGMWKLSEVAYWIKQGVWPDPAIVPDIYFPYVSLLLSTTSLGNANNNLFVDSSGAFNPVSRNGNTTQGSFSPYSTNWSNYFDGDGDYLDLSDNAAFQFGSGDFTYETWVYPTKSYSTAGLIQQGLISWGVPNQFNNSYTLNFGIEPTSGVLAATVGTGFTLTGTTTIPLNTWTHVVLCRTSGTTSIFVNGIRDATTTTASTLTSSGGAILRIGGQWYANAAARQLGGYMSNVRIIKGAGPYNASSSTITVPTSPLTAISGTSLLTCQSNRFRDASTNNFTITVAGNTSVTDFGPFSPAYPGLTGYNQSDITNWSGYFDGTGDYLTTTNTNFTGNATVECWLYVNSLANPFQVFGTNNAVSDLKWIGMLVATNGAISGAATAGSGGFYQSATGVITTGQWHHIAWVKNGSNIFVYVNGAQVATCTASAGYAYNATPLYIGRLDGNDAYCPNGFISNLRIVNGTAVYTSAFTPPTAPLTAISGTSLLTLQNAAFTDNSTNNFVITPNGNATVTGNSPFNTVGYWSNYFDGTDDAVVAPNTPANFGSNNFTAECWVMFTTNSIGYQPIMANQGSGDAQGWIISTETNNRLYFYYSTNGSSWAASIDTGITPTVGVWTHLAVVRNSNTFTFYVNGVASGTSTNSSALHSPSGNFRAGRYLFYPGGARTLTGWISNVRLVNGTAVYTGNFTPSTTPLTAIANTSLLTCQSSRFVDTSANAYSITIEGNPQVQSFDPFYTATIASNGGSMYFDGSDYLTTANGQQLFTLGATFTLDLWVYLSATPAVYAPIVETRVNANYSPWLFGIWNTGGALRLDVVSSSGRLTASSTSVPVGAWTHVTFSQVSGVARVFVNGIADSTTVSSFDWTSSSTTPTIGKSVDNYYFPGYMASFRLVKGSGVSANFTPPTAPVAPTPNTVLLLNGMNAGIYDATTINDMETVGNAQVRYPSPFAPADYWAGAFDGSGDYISVPASSSLTLGTGDFTIEMWLYSGANSTSTRLAGNGAGAGWGANKWVMGTGYAGSANKFFMSVNNGGTLLTSTTTFNDSAWHHAAVTRSGNTWRLFVDGVQEATLTSSVSVDGGIAANVSIGSGQISGDADWAGSISNFRIVKGTAVYTSNFTPSTTPLTAISGTSLLTCQNKTFIDNSTNAFTITANGNATAGAIGPFTATGGTSMYFDGSGDYLSIPNNPSLNMAGSPFTLECWICPNGNYSDYRTIISKRNASTTSYQMFLFQTTGYLSFSRANTAYQSSATPTANVWSHVAAVYDGTNINLYLNGTRVLQTAVSIADTADPLLIGAIYTGGENFNGYIDDLRVTRGVARYTSNFTPPTQPFPIY